MYFLLVWVILHPCGIAFYSIHLHESFYYFSASTYIPLFLLLLLFSGDTTMWMNSLLGEL